MLFKIIAVLVLVLWAAKSRSAFFPSVVYTLLTLWAACCYSVVGKVNIPLNVLGGAALSFAALWGASRTSERWYGVPVAILAAFLLFMYPVSLADIQTVIHRFPGNMGTFGEWAKFLALLTLFGGAVMIFAMEFAVPIAAVVHCLRRQDMPLIRRILVAVALALSWVAFRFVPILHESVPVSSVVPAVYLILQAPSLKWRLLTLAGFALATGLFLMFCVPGASRPAKSGAHSQTSKPLPSSHSDTQRLYLKNGLSMDGISIQRDAGGVWLETDPGAKTYFSNAEVDRVVELKKAA